ncbi:MAG: MarR family winged helix-turn-helix transcriptional regulator [Acidimicrobiales bacterium]
MRSDPATEAWLCIIQLTQGDENRRRFFQAATALDANPSLLRGLLCLAPGEEKPMRALVEEWNCDPSWVTSVVDELEQRGWAERRADAVDRRAKTVVLTELGEQERQRAFTYLGVPPRGIAALTVAEQSTLRDLLGKATADLPPLR